MLTQAKIDLAVLLKLFQHSEAGGGAETPLEIANLFQTNISTRRIELALEALASRGEVDREYHPHYADEGLWQISRAGLRTVEKALRLPNSFIARLHAGGDAWLDSEEAHNAELSKNPRYDEPALGRPLISPTEVITTEAVKSVPEKSDVDWTKWGTVIGALALMATIVIAVLT